eukprot:CAMPEP_0174235232 /NCGR_PEP_ID=MMETSP0417-20130205/4748_1 /TAXON_ID=242541 /ORGANISM="Mayorella sp, Strain BSH-02190019" /LENGTH=1026 /DNA_ID=CAMNT_0015313713 /DNA_START=174 /DNA_END=3254 /DNA_ORIENTATION=+
MSSDSADAHSEVTDNAGLTAPKLERDSSSTAARKAWQKGTAKLAVDLFSAPPDLSMPANRSISLPEKAAQRLGVGVHATTRSLPSRFRMVRHLTGTEEQDESAISSSTPSRSDQPSAACASRSSALSASAHSSGICAPSPSRSLFSLDLDSSFASTPSSSSSSPSTSTSSSSTSTTFTTSTFASPAPTLVASGSTSSTTARLSPRSPVTRGLSPSPSGRRSPRSPLSSPRAHALSPSSSSAISSSTPSSSVTSSCSIPLHSESTTTTTTTTTTARDSCLFSRMDGTLSPPIPVPELHSGYLFKTGGRRPTPGHWQRRWCTLQPSQFLYARRRSAPAAGVIDLSDDFFVSSLTEKDTDSQYLFNVVKESRTFFFYASTADDRDIWVRALSLARLELQQRKVHGTQNNRRGWLKKKGAKRRNWTRRFCELDMDAELLHYSENERTLVTQTYKGTVELSLAIRADTGQNFRERRLPSSVLSSMQQQQNDQQQDAEKTVDRLSSRYRSADELIRSSPATTGGLSCSTGSLGTAEANVGATPSTQTSEWRTAGTTVAYRQTPRLAVLGRRQALTKRSNTAPPSSSPPTSAGSPLLLARSDSGTLKDFSFFIETPSRTYWFQASNSTDQRDWVELLQRVVSRYSNSMPAVTAPVEKTHTTKMLFSTLSRSFSSSLVAKRAAAEASNSLPGSPTLKPAVAESLVVDFALIQFEERLGAGSFGEVWKVRYNDRYVAAKVIKDPKNYESIRDFGLELQLLSMLKSPNVVNVIGGCITPKVCLLMDFCNGGSLCSWLKSHQESFTLDQFFAFGVDIVRGLSTLHHAKPEILHRDLKSLNILVHHVGEETTLKLCDFGLARKNTSTNRKTLATLRGTYEYAAPEVVGKGIYSGASDIYSVGVILWEMIHVLCTRSYQKPFGHVRLPTVAIVVKVMQGVRPPLPENCPSAIVSLITPCWQSDPTLRPSCTTLLEALLQLQSRCAELCIVEQHSVASTGAVSEKTSAPAHERSCEDDGNGTHDTSSDYSSEEFSSDDFF